MRFEVRKSSTEGFGCFAVEDFKAGERVVIPGELIKDAIDYDSNTCMEVDYDTVWEPATPFKFLNHSCDPNAQFEVLDLNGPPELIARRDIKSGEEVTINYGWDVDDKIPCRCGCACCRGIIGAVELVALE
jgi:hypothetical protein